MGPIGPEQLKLFALELGKIAAFSFVYSLSIYKYKPVSTKLDKFDYGSSHARSVSVIFP